MGAARTGLAPGIICLFLMLINLIILRLPQDLFANHKTLMKHTSLF